MPHVTRDDLAKLLLASEEAELQQVAGFVRAFIAALPASGSAHVALVADVNREWGFGNSGRSAHNRVGQVRKRLPAAWSRTDPLTTRYIEFSLERECIRAHWQPLAIGEARALTKKLGDRLEAADPLLQYVVSQTVHGAAEAVDRLGHDEERLTLAGFMAEVEQSFSDALLYCGAACGRKLDHEAEGAPETTRTYMQHYYDWATSLKPEDRVRLCRVFVPGPHGFDAIDEATIARHGACGERVRGLTISPSGTDDVERRCPGLIERMRSGYGFVLFIYRDRTVAFVHEGLDESLVYRRIEQEEMLVSLMRLYRVLVSHSIQYGDDASAIETFLAHACVVPIRPIVESRSRRHD